MSITTNTPRVVVTARLEPATLELLREIAVRDDRSISAELRCAVIAHVDRYQRRTEGEDVTEKQKSDLIAEFCLQESRRRAKRDCDRVVEFALRDVRGAGERKRLARSIRTSYGYAEIVEELSGL